MLPTRLAWRPGTSGRQVRRLSHDAAFLRFFRADEIADHGKAGRDADAVAAAGSSRSEPVPELTKGDELIIRGTILAINAAKRTEAAPRRG